VYLCTAHLNKQSQGAESQQDKNVFRSCLNSLRHTSRYWSSTGRLSHSQVRQPQNFYHLAVAKGLHKCERPLTRGADIPHPWRVGSPPTDTVGWDREETCTPVLRSWNQLVAKQAASEAVSIIAHQPSPKVPRLWPGATTTGWICETFFKNLTRSLTVAWLTSARCKYDFPHIALHSVIKLTHWHRKWEALSTATLHWLHSGSLVSPIMLKWGYNCACK